MGEAHVEEERSNCRWKLGAKKYAKTMVNFGIECLKTVDHALGMDKKTPITLWADVIANEMKNL